MSRAIDPSTVPLFGMKIHAVREREAYELVRAWTLGDAGALRYVVTPNVQHTMVFQEHAAFREAYSAASLVIADGWPLVASSRLFGTPLPERVTGSDLLPGLFDTATADAPLSVFLMGGAEGVGEKAREIIHQRWPHVRIVGVLSPPLGFERDERLCERITEATGLRACTTVLAYRDLFRRLGTTRIGTDRDRSPAIPGSDR